MEEPNTTSADAPTLLVWTTGDEWVIADSAQEARDLYVAQLGPRWV